MAAHMALALLLAMAPFGGAGAEERPEAPAFVELDGNRLFPVSTNPAITHPHPIPLPWRARS